MLISKSQNPKIENSLTFKQFDFYGFFRIEIKAIFSTKSRKTKFAQMNNICSDECKSAKAVFVRSFTLITNSKKLAYRKSK